MGRDIHFCECGEEIFDDMEQCRQCSDKQADMTLAEGLMRIPRILFTLLIIGASISTITDALGLLVFDYPRTIHVSMFGDVLDLIGSALLLLWCVACRPRKSLIVTEEQEQ